MKVKTGIKAGQGASFTTDPQNSSEPEGGGDSDGSF